MLHALLDFLNIKCVSSLFLSFLAKKKIIKRSRISQKMSLGRNREGLQGGDGPSVSPPAQPAGGGSCVWTRCCSAMMKPEGSGHHLQCMSLLVPTSKFGLANAFSQVTFMLLPSVWYRWKGCPGPCTLQSPRPARRRRSLVLTWRCCATSAF